MKSFFLRSFTGFAVVLALTTQLIGCARPINRAAERRIRDALPDLIGPARQYRAHVENAPDQTIQGRLATVLIDGDDVELPTGLVVDRLHLELKGVEVDTARKAVRRVREAQFTITISQKTLDQFLVGEMPEGETIRNTRVALGNDAVTISAERVVLGVGVPFHLTGPLRVAGPQRVEIDPTRLTVVGIPISGLPLRFLKSRLESGVDLSRLAFPVQLTGVQTLPGQLTLRGTADVEAILQQAQARRK